MSPDEMLARLVEKAPRQKKTLEAIFAVCREIEASESTDYSYTNVSRLGQGRGVPKSQSIYNETGVNYQALIKCFAAQQGVRKRFRPRVGHAWAEEIEDPRIRILVQQTLAELAEAQRTIKEIVPPGTVIMVDDRTGTAPDYKLSRLERRALEYLRSDDFILDWKLQRGQSGDVLDPDGKSIFKPATMQAIDKVLKIM
ncbi:gamma-mobile-trio protein GmtX [Pseudomonas putida]|uniref:gamma-mobile-trio protein GmtX n=1 Tax=Pseudomonas putida TaxID=303 RepID=UPI0039065DD5